MGSGQVTPPPGFQLENQGLTPPPGFQLENSARPGVPKPPDPMAGISGYDAVGPVKEGSGIGETLGNLVGGFAKNIYQISAPGIVTSILGKQAPEVAQHLPQTMRENAAPPERLPGQIVMNAAPLMLGAESPVETSSKPSIAAPESPIEAPSVSSPTPSMGQNVGNAVMKAGGRFLKGRIPGYHLAEDAAEFVKDVRGPTPKPIASPEPVIPPTWGKGQFGTPVSEWGKTIETPSTVPSSVPPIATPESKLVPIWRDATSARSAYAGETEPPPSIAPPEPIWPENYRNAPQTLDSSGGGGANDTAEDLLKLKQSMGIAPPESVGRFNPVSVAERPPMAPAGSRADLLDDQSLQDAMRADLDAHGESSWSEFLKEQADRNSMDTPKWMRIASETVNPAVEPVRPYPRYTEDLRDVDIMPAIEQRIGQSSPPKPVTSESLEPILKKSLDAARKRK